MWTTRFFTEFRDDDQGLWRVDIQAPDYSGAPVRLTPAGNPLEWMSCGSEGQTENMIGGTGTLRLLIEIPEQMALFTANGVLPKSALSRRVIVTREALTVWVGYVQMQTFSQDWEAAPVEIELPLMDTVEALSHIYIDTDETAATTMQLLRSAYAKALQGDNTEATGNEVGGVSLTDFARTNVKDYRDRYNEWNGKDWSEAEVFPGYYFEPETEGKPGDSTTYGDAIAQILSPFGRLSQTGARWLFSIANVFRSEIYKPDPNNPDKWMQVAPDEWREPADISDAVASADNNQSVLPTPSKVVASYDPEGGAEDYSGDTVCEFKPGNIKNNSSNRNSAINVLWEDESDNNKAHTLRYLCIGDGKSGDTLNWPVTLVNRHHFRCTWQVLSPFIGGDYDKGPIRDRTLDFSGGAVFPLLFLPGSTNTDTTWRQVVNNEKGWKVTEAQTYCMACNIWRAWHEDSLWFYTNYVMIGDIVTLAVDNEVRSDDTFVLSLKFAMKTEQLTKEASFIGENENTKVWQPMVQLYWSKEKGGEPTKFYNRTNGKWLDCQGYFFPNNGHDASMVRYEEIKNGKQFRMHNDCGYISMRIFSSGWPSGGEDMTLEVPSWHHCNNNLSFFVMTGFKLAYEPYTGDIPVSLLEWNERYRDDKTVTYNDGTEELSLKFRTLASAAPTPSAFLAPRWGFCDYAMNVVTSPREMVDIDAVQVTTNSGIPGVTCFSLFQFQVKDEPTPRTYYPAAIGMNARDNTVRLKLIRTL